MSKSMPVRQSIVLARASMRTDHRNGKSEYAYEWGMARLDIV